MKATVTIRQSEMEEEMEDTQQVREAKNQVLSELRVYLCQKLEPYKYYAPLRQMRIFDENDQLEVEGKVTLREKVSALLDKLQKRDDAYDVLMKVLLKNPEITQNVRRKMKETLRRLLSDMKDETNV